MEVRLQIWVCLLLLTLPKGCNNHLLVRAAAPCEVTQQGTCPESFLLDDMPMVRPWQRPQLPPESPWHSRSSAHQTTWLQR